MKVSQQDTANSLIDKAMGDPARMYAVPGNVLADGRLSYAEKKTILESWALDQRRLMESEDENMPQAQPGRSSAAALYQDVLEVCRRLDAER